MIKDRGKKVCMVVEISCTTCVNNKEKASKTSVQTNETSAVNSLTLWF